MFEALGVGGLADYEGVAENGRSKPLYIFVGSDIFHTGSYSTHDIALDPAFVGHAEFFSLDGLIHRVGIVFGSGTLCGRLPAFVVDDYELPCAAEVAHDTCEVDFAFGKHLVPECGVAGGTHVDGAALLVDEHAVLARRMIGREFGLAALLEMNVLKAYELALILALRLGVGADERERRHHNGIDIGDIGGTVQFGVAAEILRRHKADLIGVALGVPRGHAHLHKTAVLAYVHTRDVHHYILPHTVVEVEVIGVDGKCQCACFVLNHKAFEHIGLLV